MKNSFLTFIHLLILVCLPTLYIPVSVVKAQNTAAVEFDLSHTDSIPVLSLTFDADQFNNKTFVSASLTLYDADSTHTYHCEVRHRGATSLAYDKPNYAIKLLDDTGASLDSRLVGLRKDNYWILDAMASDFGKMRNRVSMDLWLNTSRKAYHQESEPKAINGYRGRFVEVYVNEEYQGLYCLMERVDRKQLKLRKYKKEHEEYDEDSVLTTVPAYHRGLLYKAVNGSSTRTPYLLYQSNEPNNKKHTYDGMQCEYPDVDEGEPWTWEPLRTNIYFMAAKTASTFNSKIHLYFDIPVFIDYVLFIDLLYANDNVGKNVMYWFYDQSSGDQRLSVTPWDLDTSWGRDYMGSRVSATKVLANKSNFHTRFDKWYTGYADTLATRYAELRDSLWREDVLCRYFDRYFELFRTTGAWQREVERWDNSNCKTRGIDEEQQYVTQWIHDRLTYLDECYGYETPELTDETPEPADPNRPVITDDPGDSDTPDDPDDSDDPDTPDDPDDSDDPDTPDDPDDPDDPDTPDNPDDPDDSDDPDDPDDPDDAITLVNADSKTDVPCYDLMGRRTSGLHSGIIFFTR